MRMSGKLIDVREYPEFALGHIAGALLVPLSHLAVAAAGWDRNQPLTMVCESGHRALQAMLQLQHQGFSKVEILEGGMAGWRAAGKAIESAARRPWAMERQVRVVAGALVVIFVSLGVLVSPWFLLGAGFVGAGLVFAGVSNTCMMGDVLGRMPWNRQPMGAK